MGSCCCVNITVAVLNERSSILDFPSQLNRSIGLVERAINKTKELLKHAANVEFIIYNMDHPFCTDLRWGALVAELYHKKRINAIIGPGNVSVVNLVWSILTLFTETGNCSRRCTIMRHTVDPRYLDFGYLE